VFWYNQRWYDYTGTTIDQVRGWGWTRSIHPDHAGRVVHGMQKCLLLGEPWEDTFPLRDTQENYRWFLSRAVPIRDAAGSVVRWFGTNTDITERKQAEEALVKSERLAAMGRLAGIIAHEINNPLEAISNAFYLLRDHPSLDEEARYYARLAAEEVARITHITKQTLSFYRESRQPVAVSLSELLDNVVELQSRPLKLNAISVEKKYTTPGIIQGFPVELKQVFLNIIGNAVQAMAHGGRLRIRLYNSVERRSGREGIRVHIDDTGTGISCHDAKRIFEPFFSTKETKGTGLGLWISKGIIQKYEGSIRFRSMHLGKGHVTCFSVFIPADVAAQRIEKMATSVA
jgi:PAS domain S-box-containing protein